MGGVSWTTFSRLLTGLVGQLQGKVEMLLDELLQLFEPILSRVECLVLVEIFQKMEYLTLYKIKESKPTLFSDDSKRNIEIGKIMKNYWSYGVCNVERAKKS